MTKSKMKQTEIGMIPEDWDVKRIDAFADVKTGGTPSTKNKEYWGGNIKWMSSGEIHKKFVFDTEKKITQKGMENSNAKLLPENSVVLALNGQGKTKGTVAVLKVSSTCNQSLACIIPNKEIIDYLYLFYNLDNRYSEIRRYGGMKGREGLNLNIVKQLKVPIPSLKEQKAISEIISTIDSRINIVDEKIQKTELIKKGVMKKLFDGKQNKTELNKIGSLIDGDWILKEDYTPTGVRLLQIGDIGVGSFVNKSRKFISVEKSKKCTIVKQEKDILISRMPEPIGRACLAPKLPQQYIVAVDITIFTINDKLVNTRYVLYALNYKDTLKEVDKLSAGATRIRISRKNLESIKIPLPTLSEQTRIADILSTIDQKLSIQHTKKSKLERIKKSLMNDLLTGKKRVGGN